MGDGGSEHEQGDDSDLVGRVVAVVLAARELARLGPVARVVGLLAPEPWLV